MHVVDADGANDDTGHDTADNPNNTHRIITHSKHRSLKLGRINRQRRLRARGLQSRALRRLGLQQFHANCDARYK